MPGSRSHGIRQGSDPSGEGPSSGNLCGKGSDCHPREGIVIIATGPLTEGALAEDIENFCGGEGFHFYDAAAPIVTKDSLDMDVVYRMSRYNKGEAAYLNCPMNEEEYKAFREALCQAEMAPVHGFENKKVFEAACPSKSWLPGEKILCASGP
mgnify:CR=1 FL=1